MRPTIPNRVELRGGLQRAQFLAVLASTALAFGGYLLLEARSGHYRPGQILSEVFGGLFLLQGLVAAGFVPAALRPIVWTPQSLRVPKGFRTIVIPIDEIAGLGLLYCKGQAGSRAPVGWFAYLFRADGSTVRLGDGYAGTGRVAKPANSAARPRFISLSARPDPLVSTDPVALGQSRPANLVRDLETLVTSVQGPHGALATRQMQKHTLGSRWSRMSAYWSPDGEMGPVKQDG